MSHQVEVILRESDNLLRVKRVTNGLTGVALEGATVTATIYSDKALTAVVTGQTFPLQLPFEPTFLPIQDRPAYVGTIEDVLAVAEGDIVWVKVTIDAGPGLKRTFRVEARVTYEDD